MNEDKKTFAAELLLKRFDFYIAGINSKSAFLIAFNTFVLGALVLKMQDALTIFTHPKTISLIPYLLFLVFIGSVISLYFALRASYPFLDSGNKTSIYNSLIFFGSISQMDEATFIKQVESQSEASLLEDLIRQCHFLAGGVHKKHLDIQKSIICLQFGVLIPVVSLAALKIVDYFITS